MKRRLALHAHDLSLAFEPIEHFILYLPEADRSTVVDFLRDGEAMACVMLDSAHGLAVPATALPSVSMLNLWRRGANGCVRQLRALDPDYLESYMNRLPAADRRIVESMTLAGF